MGGSRFLSAEALWRTAVMQILECYDCFLWIPVVVNVIESTSLLEVGRLDKWAVHETVSQV